MTPPHIRRRAHPRGLALAALAMLAGLLTWSIPGQAQTKPTLPEWLPGVNLASGTFKSKGTRLFFDYTYPTKANIDYYVGKGLRVFRIGFLSGRLIPSLDDKTGKLKDAEIIDELVSYAGRKGAYVVLDMHDYGGNKKGLIGRDPEATAEFTESWRQIAARYKSAPNVIFGLMNEPNKQSATEWLVGANAAIAAIRDAGASQLILVPGSYWDGAWRWTSTDNGKVMLGVQDPQQNYAFEVHQYFDSDGSGTSADVVTGSGAKRLEAFTSWARLHKKRGFLGEFGWARTEEAAREGEAALAYMGQNRDVWLGWAYWSGGPWWGDYMYTSEPKDGEDRPQMKLLERYARP